MKKLQKLVLHKAVKMTAPQMKHITGGYDFGRGTECIAGTINTCEGEYYCKKNGKEGKCKWSGSLETGCICDV